MRGPWVLAILLLSGCLASPGPPTSAPGTHTVTRPDDYGYLEGENASAAHVHDYWNGRSTLPLIDASEQGILGMAYQPVPVAAWQPAGDVVVPQGARWVNLTVTLSPKETDMYSRPQLWVRTAADREPRFVADLQSGKAVSMEVTNVQNDLPHQRLSAWYFQVRLSPPDDVRPARYNGLLHLRAEVHRGLPIEPFPGHPDRWKDEQGRDLSEIRLFDEANEVFFATQEDNVCCLNHSHPPQDGAVVPHAYDRVVAELTWDATTPHPLGLVYHAADTRDFKAIAPKADASTRRTYEIRGADPDGPYARQSLWDFGIVVDGDPQFFRGSYRLVVTVHRVPT